MGLHKIKTVWNQVRDSLWFLPSVLTLAAALLALVTIQLDATGILPESPAGLWLFSGTASGARGVLTAIASGFITVTGVVFSITIVALQLASTQFTPRILRNFTADRANQLVLGVFIATFTYALLVLRVVRGENGVTEVASAGTAGQPAAGGAAIFVPHLSVTVAVLLAVLGIGFLIFYIHHAARSVQASDIIHRVTDDALQTMERMLPERFGQPGAEDPGTAIPEAAGSAIPAERSGYVQAIDEDHLLDVVRADALTVRVDADIGQFLLPGAALATVWPAGLEQDEELAGAVRRAFVVGQERTPHMDLELGLIELSDIAVKALSPGINDPTTAILCLDRIGQILLALARHEAPHRVRQLPGHQGLLVLPMPRFEHVVDTALDQIRHFGSANPRFVIDMLHRLGELGSLLPHRDRPPVARHAAALLRTARSADHDRRDLARIEDAADRALERLEPAPSR